ncbi:MAG TPA: hypothetical protein VLZ03_03245, partial [Thermodesulfobacteriota bacterium]|nr:hypothetical protein [Thermodesulfobacteriota bacterium]
MWHIYRSLLKRESESGWKRIKKDNLMKIKITVLCENLVGKLVGSGEHGFSAFIETAEGNFLFDTGSGHSVVPNSLAL